MSKTSVFCIATSHSQAERIVENLQGAGFPSEEISVLLPADEGQHDIGHVKATKAPEGATTGATAGGVTGGVIGLLAGIGALAIPGVGPLIAAGPIMAALSGAAIGGATGGIVGGLIGLGIPEIEAKRYEQKLKEGNYFISVHAHDGDQEDTVREIFKAANAEDITSSSLSSAPEAHSS
ncbi:MAG: hypothetical protein ABIR29_12235 [Chthoniobacterales bacterium]